MDANELPESQETQETQETQEIETPEIHAHETRTPARRRSRKTLVSQIEETLRQIDADIEAGNNKPSRSNLLQAKLEMQTLLLKREDERQNSATLAENTALKQEVAAFKELNVTPEQVAELREENQILAVRLGTAAANSRNDTETITRQQNEICSLKKSLVYAVQAIGDPLFAMRAFITFGRETRDELLGDARVREWVQFAMAYPTKDALLAYLRVNRAKTGVERQIAYCFARLAVEHAMTSADCEKLFQAEDEKRRREDLQRAQEDHIREVREANLRQPKGIAGSAAAQEGREWMTPIPVRSIERPVQISGGSDFAPWVK